MGHVAQIVQVTGGLRVDGPVADATPQVVRGVVGRAQSGDAAAFDQLIVLFRRKVISTAWRVLGNQDDAFDAAQEVFIKLHRYLHTFRLDQDFSAWLYRLIVNACHDTRKRRGQHVSFEQERERGNLGYLRSPDDVEAQVEAAQQERIVAAALDTLAPKERAALVLRDLEGLSTHEVAKVLGSSPTTIRSQICLARAKIKEFRDRVMARDPGRDPVEVDGDKQAGDS